MVFNFLNFKSSYNLIVRGFLSYTFMVHKFDDCLLRHWFITATYTNTTNTFLVTFEEDIVRSV